VSVTATDAVGLRKLDGLFRRDLDGDGSFTGAEVATRRPPWSMAPAQGNPADAAQHGTYAYQARVDDLAATRGRYHGYDHGAAIATPWAVVSGVSRTRVTVDDGITNDPRCPQRHSHASSW